MLVASCFIGQGKLAATGDRRRLRKRHSLLRRTDDIDFERCRAIVLRTRRCTFTAHAHTREWRITGRPALRPGLLCCHRQAAEYRVMRHAERGKITRRGRQDRKKVIRSGWFSGEHRPAWTWKDEFARSRYLIVVVEFVRKELQILIGRIDDKHIHVAGAIARQRETQLVFIDDRS